MLAYDTFCNIFARHRGYQKHIFSQIKKEEQTLFVYSFFNNIQYKFFFFFLNYFCNKCFIFSIIVITIMITRCTNFSFIAGLFLFLIFYFPLAFFLKLFLFLGLVFFFFHILF